MKISLSELKEHETILIYGKSKCGKSFSYLSVVERCVKAGNKCWILNTDNGLKRTLNAYFGEQADEVAKSIEYYLITSIDEVPPTIKEILANVTPKDVIIIDLLSSFWEMAQKKF